MKNYKNKLLLSLILASSVISTSDSNAATLVISSDTSSTTVFDGGTNSGYDSVTVNSGVTAGGFDPAISISTSMNSVDNNGSITTLGTGGTPSLEILNSAQVTTVNNNSTGYIKKMSLDTGGKIITLTNDGTIDNIDMTGVSHMGNLNNTGTLSLFSVRNSSSITDTFTNSGSFGELSLYSTINQITNTSTGSMNRFNLYNGSIIYSGITNSNYIGDIYAYDSLINKITNNSGGYINSVNFDGTFLTNGLINNQGASIGYISISSLDTNSHIVNAGTIQTGITVYGGPGVDLTNSGLIGNYPDYPSIDYQNAGDNILNLNAGSNVPGLIDFHAGTNNVVNVGAGVKTATIYEFNGNYNLNLEPDPNVKFVQNGNFLSILPKKYGPESVVENSNMAVVNIGNILSNHLFTYRSDEFDADKIAENEEDSYVKLASNNKNSASDAHSDLGIKGQKQPFYWSEAFGFSSDRSSYKNNDFTKTSGGGLLVGADKAIDSHQRIGGFIGALNSSTDTTDIVGAGSRGAFIGGYLSKNQKPYFTDFSLLAGIFDNDTGNPESSTNYTSAFLTPSVTFGKKLNILPVSVSGTLRYTGQWVDNNDDIVGGETITTKSKYLHDVSGRIEIRSNDKVTKLANGKFSINGRFGIESNHAIGSRKVSVNVIGETVTFNPNVRNYNIDGFVGGNAAYNLREDIKIYADVEGSKGITQNLSNNHLGLFGKFGVQWNF